MSSPSVNQLFGADVSEHLLIFLQQCYAGCRLCRAIVKLLHRRGACLDVLCSYPYQNVYQFGHKLAPVDEEYLDPSGTNALVSPLILALLHHDFDLTRELVKLGAGLNFADENGRTPLMAAVYEASPRFYLLA